MILTHIQCIYYSFIFGMFCSMCYQIVDRLIIHFILFIKCIIQMINAFVLSLIYYYGMVLIDEGVLRIYYFIFILMGYLFYRKYYAMSIYLYVEKLIYVIKKILKPFIFVFVKINVIMKSARKVKYKWRRKKDLNTENS